MKEVWRDIIGYEGLYQVSNFGNIKSLHQYRGRGNILCLRIKKGYYTIGLRRNNQRKWFLVHRLVANAFIPNENNYPNVNHKDENKLNNNVDNLEWCTTQYNNCYGSRLKRVSESNPNKKSVVQFDNSGKIINKYNSIADAARENNISTSDISRCMSGKRKTAKGFIWKSESEVVPNGQ